MALSPASLDHYPEGKESSALAQLPFLTTEAQRENKTDSPGVLSVLPLQG